MTKPNYIELPDGRKLAYVEMGDPHGHPVFYFHGTPGSRLEFSSEDPFVQAPGLRFICPERPGYGFSDPKPDRTLVDWPRDVAALADHLEIRSFAVVGASGGGPHAVACGYVLPDRVKTVVLLASPSPGGVKGATKGMAFGNKIGIWTSRLFPGFVRWGIHSTARTFQTDPNKVLDAINAALSRPDQQLMEQDTVREAFRRDLTEAYRQGGEGHVIDSTLAMTNGPWGFNLADVQVPVYMWQGEVDTLVTLAMANHLAASLNCEVRYVADAGHFLAEHPDVIQEVHEVLRQEMEPQG